jgi:enoyl-CoA hydratase
MGRYDRYTFLQCEQLDDGIMLVRFNNPEKLNATDHVGHREMSDIWRDLDEDPDVRVSIITGAGKGFCSGGDLRVSNLTEPAAIWKSMASDARIVHGMVASRKPIISAINGVAVGAGAAVAVLADISIAGESARLIDGHTKLGVVAGDHAALVWPLLCGLARSKYYMLTCETVSGQEAADIGLVSKCVPDNEVMTEAMRVAKKLTHGSQWAIQGTKRALNQWFVANMPIFEQSMGLEFASFMMGDVDEGINSILEKRPPNFQSSGTW